MKRDHVERDHHGHVLRRCSNGAVTGRMASKSMLALLDSDEVDMHDMKSAIRSDFEMQHIATELAMRKATTNGDCSAYSMTETETLRQLDSCPPASPPYADGQETANEENDSHRDSTFKPQKKH